MKFKIDRNTLLTALQKVSIAVMPYKKAWAFANAEAYLSFTCHAELDELRVQAYNMDMLAATTVSIGNPNGETKDFSFRATSFLKAIKSLDGQELTIEVLEYQIIVSHSVGSFAMPLVDCSGMNWPTVEKWVDFKTARQLTIEAPALLSVFSKCAFALANDGLRPALNGICMRLTKDYTDFAASDGHKLVRIRKRALYPTDSAVDFIFPRSIVFALLKILPKTGFADMWFKEYIVEWPEDSKEPRPDCYCRLVVDGLEILTWPEKARYPNYNSVVPESFSREFKADRAALVKSLNRLSLFSSESNMITFTLHKNEITLWTQDKDFETEGNETLPVDYSGDFVRFGFRASTLIQILNMCHTPTVTAKFSNPKNAFVFAPSEQPQYEDITLLLMPMIIGD